jgi:glycine/D-amino acid oxidase-like deaminating enzyme
VSRLDVIGRRYRLVLLDADPVFTSGACTTLVIGGPAAMALQQAGIDSVVSEVHPAGAEASACSSTWVPGSFSDRPGIAGLGRPGAADLRRRFRWVPRGAA